jgi:hypothetical protein
MIRFLNHVNPDIKISPCKLSRQEIIIKETAEQARKQASTTPVMKTDQPGVSFHDLHMVPPFIISNYFVSKSVPLFNNN